MTMEMIIAKVEEMVANSEEQIYREELTDYICDAYHVNRDEAEYIAWYVI